MKETSAKILRRNKEYYLNELKLNAIRSKKKKYNLSDEKRKAIKRNRKKRQDNVGFYKRRKWTNKEINYLKRHQGKDYSRIAIKLERSLSSIEHKIERLGLQKYNKWN